MWKAEIRSFCLTMGRYQWLIDGISGVLKKHNIDLFFMSRLQCGPISKTSGSLRFNLEFSLAELMQPTMLQRESYLRSVTIIFETLLWGRFKGSKSCFIVMLMDRVDLVIQFYFRH